MRLTNYITPECCEKAITSKAIRLGFYSQAKFCEYKNIKPGWYILGDNFVYDHHFPVKIQITECPFCHSKLPDLELANDGKKIAEGDEEYCHTCDQRHMCCDCYPPEFRWKI